MFRLYSECWRDSALLHLKFFHIYNTSGHFNLQNCKSTIKFLKNNEKGLEFDLVIKCKYESVYNIPSSPQIHNFYEVNRRMVFAMCLLGIGLQRINIFCGLMDISHALSKSGYYEIINHI